MSYAWLCAHCAARVRTQPGCHAGVSLPLLQQSMMFWQIGLGYLLLGKRLAPIQVISPTQCDLLEEVSH